MLSFLIRFSETGAHTREINYVGKKESYFDGKYILRSPPTTYPVKIRHHPSKSVIIRQYPSKSVKIRQNPSLSVIIRHYPSSSVR